MKKKILFFQILYYILFALLYAGAFFGLIALLKTNNLAAAVVRTFLLVFVLTPTLILIFARFSLLKWYVDPFAAAIVPLLYYITLLRVQWEYEGSLKMAFSTVNWALADDHAIGWILLTLVFLFGLLSTFSPARKAGRNISYRLINKIIAE